MEKATAQAQVKMGSERSFGLVFAGAFAVIGLLPLVHGGEVRLWALGIGAAFGALGLLLPRVLKPLNYLWFRFGLLLGAVVAPIVMAIVFFAVFLPTGLIMRLRGHDLLNYRLDGGAETYWTTREESAGSMKKQF